jgi:hypothetical protein
MPTTEHCRWWLVSSPELFPAPLFTDPDTMAGLVADTPGLTAVPIPEPVLPDPPEADGIFFPAD